MYVMSYVYIFVISRYGLQRGYGDFTPNGLPASLKLLPQVIIIVLIISKHILSDGYTQNCQPQNSQLVGNSEVGNLMLSPRWDAVQRKLPQDDRRAPPTPPANVDLVLTGKVKRAVLEQYNQVSQRCKHILHCMNMTFPFCLTPKC